MNIEIKARAPDFARTLALARGLSGRREKILLQEDVFFAVPRGYLKLRILGAEEGELISYDREIQAGPKRSVYRSAKTSDPGALRLALASSLEIRGVVRKERRIFDLGHARVHLDRVEGLGDFVEVEVPSERDSASMDGRAAAGTLMTQLDIAVDDLIEVAYIDLLLSRR